MIGRGSPLAVDAVDAPVVEVREEDRAAVPPDGAAAVLVHARARVESARRQLDSRRRRRRDERCAALLGRLAARARAGRRRRSRRPRSRTTDRRRPPLLDRDRRAPRAVRCNGLRHRRITNGSEHVRHERLRAERVPDAEREARSTPSAGASRPNDRRTRGRDSVSPKPLESSDIDTAVKNAKTPRQTTASAWLGIDASSSTPTPARAADPVDDADRVRLKRRRARRARGARRRARGRARGTRPRRQRLSSDEREQDDHHADRRLGVALHGLRQVRACRGRSARRRRRGSSRAPVPRRSRARRRSAPRAPSPTRAAS